MPSAFEMSTDDSSYQKNSAAEISSNSLVDGHDAEYDWKEFWNGGNILQFFRFVSAGTSSVAHQSDEARNRNLVSLARMLVLLREYHDNFGMPDDGGPKDQEYVLREVCKDLYAGGAPIWSLEPVMEKAAEGLTGKRGVDFFLLPRKAFIFAPSSGATIMFRIERGFDMQRLNAMERIVVRLASFASNTHSVASVPTSTEKPTRQILYLAMRRGSAISLTQVPDPEKLSEEILALASENEGLYYYVNSESQMYGTQSSISDDEKDEGESRDFGMRNFWKVEGSTCELFSRLAAKEAMMSMDKMDKDMKVLYSKLMINAFRMVASAGACAIWFQGSWWDLLVAAILAVLVSWIGTLGILTRQERLIIEVIASFTVGLTAGLIALTWRDQTCFGAMALAGVLDILQGFRVVYAVIELMSKHTVTGTADFVEAILFTGLIAYFLKFGQHVAVVILRDGEYNFPTCTNGIDQVWYFLFVPAAAFSWSGLFMADHADLPLMGLHGILAFVVSWSVEQVGWSNNINNFLGGMAVTLSAGLVSRFTGKQALGNTVAGLYVLMPGAYLVDALFTSNSSGFLEGIIIRSVTIGLGAWTGTIICSPTILGATRGLVQKGPSNTSTTHRSSRRDTTVRKAGTGAMLFF